MIVNHRNAHLSHKYELLAIVSDFLIYEAGDQVYIKAQTL